MEQLKNKYKFPSKINIINEGEKDRVILDIGLNRLINKHLTNNVKIIFDIGCNVGTATKRCLKISSDVIVIAVDTWITSKKENIYDNFINNVIDYKDRVIPIKMDINKALLYLQKYDIIPDLILLNVITLDKSVNKELLNICKLYPSSKVIGNDILSNKNIGLEIKEFLGKKCTKYIVEIDENSFVLIPKFYDYKNYNSSVKFNKIKEGNISKKPLYIILFYPNTEFGRSNSVKWYNSFKKIRHKIKVENYILILFEQNNNFYLGQMYNIGFKIINDVNANYIFHAANLIPDNKLIKYYSSEPTNPIHLDVGNKNYAYNYDQLGTFMISGTDLLRINGFANNQAREQVWFLTFMRMATNNFIVDQPIQGKMKQIYDSFRFENKSVKDLTLIDEHWKTWKKNGLNDIKYGVYKYKKIKEKDYFYYVKANSKIISFNKELYLHSGELKIDNNFSKSKISKVLPILKICKEYFKNKDKIHNVISNYYNLNKEDSYKFSFSDTKYENQIYYRSKFPYHFDINENTKILLLVYVLKNIDIKNIYKFYLYFFSKMNLDLFLISDSYSKVKQIKKIKYLNLYTCSLSNFYINRKYDVINLEIMQKNIDLYKLYNYSNKEIFNDANIFNEFVLNILKNYLNKHGKLKVVTWFPFNIDQLKYISNLCNSFESNRLDLFYDFRCWHNLYLNNYNGFLINKNKMIDIKPFINRVNDLNILLNNITTKYLK